MAGGAEHVGEFRPGFVLGAGALARSTGRQQFLPVQVLSPGKVNCRLSKYHGSILYYHFIVEVEARNHHLTLGRDKVEQSQHDVPKLKAVFG